MSALEPYYDDGQVRLYVGDCLDVLAGIANDSVDAVVMDPPYGLEFMGREWDTFRTGDGFRRSRNEADAGRESVFGRTSRTSPEYITGKPSAARIRERVDGRTNPAEGKSVTRTPEAYVAGSPFQAWCETWAGECLRVLKPGGYMLAFGGARTWHRLACAVEDAGFEIRDSISWLYGSGFPKSLDVSKAIDKAAGAERAVLAPDPYASRKPSGTWNGATYAQDAYEGIPGGSPVTAPATPDAGRWEGWGTALKPAHEPVTVARKPLAGSVAANVLAHGTGALNINGCRVGEGGYDSGGARIPGDRRRDEYRTGTSSGPHALADSGRWPPNVLLTHSATCDVRDEGGGEIRVEGACAQDCPVAELDRQSGVLTSGANPARRGTDKFRDAYGEFAGQQECTVHRGADAGGASRFFPAFRYEAKAPASERPRLADGTAHPTVKPLELMRWLVRLVTPPGGTVADFFAGSGTTGEACVIEGFNCILAEKDPASAELIKARLSKPIQPVMFGLEAS